MKKPTAVSIVKSRSTGMRFVKFGETVIPFDIAALAAGKDAWLRDVVCKCEDCQNPTTVSASDIAGVCPECMEQRYAEIEN